MATLRAPPETRPVPRSIAHERPDHRARLQSFAAKDDVDPRLPEIAASDLPSVAATSMHARYNERYAERPMAFIIEC
jgi:hypothetical protein